MKPNYKEHIRDMNKQTKELIGLYREAGRHLDISESEVWVWYTLVSMEGNYTQQDICTLWSLPKQTVNTVIAHMKRKRLAFLQAVPGTRNHKTVHLTEAGRAYGEQLILPITRAEERAFDHISAEEVALVTSAFGRYLGAIRAELDSIKKAKPITEG